MGQKSNNNRQKKMAKRKAKSKMKQKSAQSLKNRVQGVILSGPIHECFIEYQEGMMSIFLARKRENTFTVSCIILDLYCLGVKNAFIAKVEGGQYLEMKARKTDDISPEQAKRVLLDGVEYAENLGFKSHKDFNKAFKAYDDIDADGVECDYEFGRDGKPLFIAGPFDSPKKCEKIINKLEKSCGKDNYHFVMPMGMPFDDEAGRYEGSEGF